MVFCTDTEDICSMALTVTAALLENYKVIFLQNKKIFYFY